MSVTDISPIELINLAIDLTTAMKKSFHKKGEDDFDLCDINWTKFLELKLNKSPLLKQINLEIWKLILYQILEAERELIKNDEIRTYNSVRWQLFMMKKNKMDKLQRSLRER